jgi:uncharacterized RDD family membrane protein YckC
VSDAFFPPAQQPALPAGDPLGLEDPLLFEGVILRRLMGYGVDLLLICLAEMLILLLLFVAGIFTLGLMWSLIPITLVILAPLYHTLTLGGQHSATPGQRIFKLEVRTWQGGHPSYLQAFAQTALFYLTLGIFAPALLVALFNKRGRTIHEYLSGTVTVRRLDS